MSRYLDYLKKTRRDLEENLEHYIKLLCELAEKYNGRVYVFGSYIRGECIGASDVDILVEIPDNINRLQVLHEARKLVSNRRVEIHVLNSSDAEIFKRIVRYYSEVCLSR